MTLFLITFCRLQSSICFQISTIEQHLSSEPHSPLSTRPLLTSTLLELDKPPLPSPAQSSFPNDTISHGHRCSLSKVSSVSQISLSSSSINSSVLTSKVKDGHTVALALSVKAEVLALFTDFWFLFLINVTLQLKNKKNLTLNHSNVGLSCCKLTHYCPLDR